ncbi:tripartite tricarboxylate transporter substrate-binding protein [Pelagibacterium limicola]|uniref:tripartite tricarboxylate transporter substrate-binding protein n=1 Tax=Pelagibacterium limicola TaxID=2791022 RepID=UPI0018B00759
MNKQTKIGRFLLLSTVSCLALGAQSALAAACPEGFPERPINFYVGFAAGGGTDSIARTLAQAIEQAQGWNIVVENRPGAASAVMAQSLLNMEPDGHSIGLGSSDTLVWNPTSGDLDFHYSDFLFLGSAMDSWNSFAALSTAPFDDIASLVEYTREIGMATVAVAGFNQTLVVEQLADQYDINLVPIPVAGSAESMMLTLGGHVDATIQGVAHLAELESGNMKQIASVTSHRLPYQPDSPTLEEQGATALPIQSVTVLMAPKGLPDDVRICLEQVVDEAVNSEIYHNLMVSFNNEALNRGPEGVVDLISSRDARIRALYDNPAN